MQTTKQPVTRLDYCQYLLVSQINYTLTNFAEHAEKFSHDAVNRYLAGNEIRPPAGAGECQRSSGSNALWFLGF
jgi:hypothetical protein